MHSPNGGEVTDSIDDLAAFLMHQSVDVALPENERLSIYALVAAYQESDDPKTVTAGYAGRGVHVRRPGRLSRRVAPPDDDQVTPLADAFAVPHTVLARLEPLRGRRDRLAEDRLFRERSDRRAGSVSAARVSLRHPQLHRRHHPAGRPISGSSSRTFGDTVRPAFCRAPRRDRVSRVPSAPTSSP